MKRFIPCRKKLTNKEARQRIANLQQSLTVHEDNIKFQWHKRGVPFQDLEFIDQIILGVDKLKSWQEFIDKSQEEIDFILKKIDDYKRFLTEPYKSFIF